MLTFEMKLDVLGGNAVINFGKRGDDTVEFNVFTGAAHLSPEEALQELDTLIGMLATVRDLIIATGLQAPLNQWEVLPEEDEEDEDEYYTPLDPEYYEPLFEPNDPYSTDTWEDDDDDDTDDEDEGFFTPMEWAFITGNKETFERDVPWESTNLDEYAHIPSRSGDTQELPAVKVDEAVQS